MIRPELREQFWTWRDVLLGLAVAILGAWWSSTAHGAVAFLGYGAIVLGVVLMIGGWQRVRFRAAGQGPGVVQIVERRLAYLGPLNGGTIEMDDLTRLELDGGSSPAVWILSAPGGQLLHIPVNAAGSDLLFDLFASLPGIKTEAMLAELARTANQRVVIWERSLPMLT